MWATLCEVAPPVVVALGGAVLVRGGGKRCLQPQVDKSSSRDAAWGQPNQLFFIDCCSYDILCLLALVVCLVIFVCYRLGLFV